MLPRQLKPFLPLTFKPFTAFQGFRYLSSKANSLYEVLGVERTCSQAHIKVAFYQQAKLMHPDVQGTEERDLEAEAFIRLAAAYEVLRDPDRRANYDAHLSSRSKIVGSAFDFDPNPPSQGTQWPDTEPMGDQHVAPWVREYRQAIRDVVRYGGEGSGLVHRVKMEFGAAVRQAYFGPEVGGLALGEWPMEFEGEERSISGIGDVMHLVSGRQLLGTVREARDILLEGGENALGKSALGTGLPGSARATIDGACTAHSRDTPFDRGRDPLESEDAAGVGLPGRSGKEDQAREGRSSEGEKEQKSRMSGSDAIQEKSRSEQPFEDRGLRTDEGTEGFRAEGKDPRSEQHNQGISEDGRSDIANEGPLRSGDHSTSSGNGYEDGDEGSFATLELTQQGQVVGVATREWVPLTENGNGNGNEVEDGTGNGNENESDGAERMDCISIYAVNRGELFDLERVGREGGWGPEEEKSSAQGRGYTKQRNADGGSVSGSGRAEGAGRESRKTRPSKCAERERVKQEEVKMGKGSRDGKGIDKWDRTRYAFESGSGDGQDIGIGSGGFGGDGWAEDVERLGLRYDRPRLLARIFGLRDGRSLIEVFRGGDKKTHTLLQHRTPLVRHVAWYRNDVDKRGRRVRKCEARLRRAALPPSSLWLFEPRATTHDCGGWYFERFEDEEPRATPPFAFLPPHTRSSQSSIDSRVQQDQSYARYSGGADTVQTSETGRGNAGSIRRQSDHKLRFEWPSNSRVDGLEPPIGEPKTHKQHMRVKSAVVPPLDPAVYILTAAYLTLDKEIENQNAKPSAVAGLFEKGAKWTGEIKSWWNRKAGVRGV